jgi:hypothetical protein
LTLPRHKTLTLGKPLLHRGKAREDVVVSSDTLSRCSGGLHDEHFVFCGPGCFALVCYFLMIHEDSRD